MQCETAESARSRCAPATEGEGGDRRGDDPNPRQELRAARRQLARLAPLTAEAPTGEPDAAALDFPGVLWMMRAAKFRDSETGAHLQRMSRLAGIVARRLGLPDDEIARIEAASALHDIGKIGIEDRVLRKAGALDPEEWKIMKRHTVIGAELLAGSRSPLLRLGQQIALSHHERWDGSGYPHGLAAEAIPLAARIVMLCDQYDALRSHRPYKPAFDHATARDILLWGDGRTEPEHLDPRLLKLFAEIHPQFADAWASENERALWPYAPGLERA